MRDVVPEIVTIRGDLELLTRTAHLLSSVREEFVCAARDLDTWSRPGARQAMAARAAHTQQGQQVHQAHQVRKLLSPAALADEHSRAHLRELVDQGALVRIASAALPHETIVIDRRLAILAGLNGPGGREYTLTTAPTLVGGVYALFDAAWETATDLKAFLRGEQPRLDTASRTVLRLLGSGATDEKAARELGMSLRTYRRRVAELLTTLEADSRFQAGIRAGELGLNG
ncbi:DNA-binding response regulator [Streptomyces sp. ID05-47C]|uniref:DNA-binding response regulator n=1 Tax=Streptomyces sp. ID05-47C TaxID=3028665 RepID=UPI0029B65C4B|nr:DNA-binding response regulator [Streptomyces sp. ID05-47C]MDX3574895.1 DNA-binding response regulator [Streptomyces sp. ID05-47C]